MFRTLVLYDDAFRLISNSPYDKDKVKDYDFKDVKDILFAYPPRTRTETWRKIFMIVLTIGLLFLPYFSGDVDFNFSREIIEITFNLKDGQKVVHRKSFDSRKKAEQFEKQLMTLLDNSKKQI